MTLGIRGLVEQEFEDNRLKLQIRNNDYNKIKKLRCSTIPKITPSSLSLFTFEGKVCLQLEITKRCMVTKDSQVFSEGKKKVVGTQSLGNHTRGGESENPKALSTTCWVFF